MRKSFKKVLCAVMAASMVFSTPIATNVVAQAAETVDVSTVFSEGVVVDASNGWNSQGGHAMQIKAGQKSIMQFTNDPFKRDNNNWSNFIIESPAAGGSKGVTLRADAYGWTFGDGVEPTFTVTNSWGAWTNWANICLGEITLIASVSDLAGAAQLVKYELLFADGSYEVYNVTYPNGVPDGLVTYVGADGAKITQNKILYVSENVDENASLAGESVDLTTVTTDVKTMDLVTNAVSEGAITATVTDYSYADGQKPTVKASSKAVTYTSLDEKVAKVTSEGKVIAVGNGSTQIQATAGTASTVVPVNVTTDTKSVAISGEGVENGKLTINLLKEKSTGNVATTPVNLSAKVMPENATKQDIEWSVEGDAVTVSNKGVVTANKDAENGATAKVKVSVKDTDVSAEIEVTVAVREVEKFVDPASVVVSPAAVTANAGEEVPFAATVYGEDGKTLATDQEVTWSAKNASGTAIDVTDEGVVKVPADAKTGDKITVTATSKANGEIVGTATITVYVYEPLTGTGWWGNHQTSKDRILKGDGSVSFLLENNAGDENGNIGFCVEAYAVNADGTKYEDASVATAEKGAYITSSYNGNFEGWVAGIPAAKMGQTDSVNFAANPDNFYNISASKEAFLPEHTYKVTFTKKGNDYLILMKDMNDDTWFYRQIFKGADMGSDTLGIHFMAQLGTFNLVDTDDHLTTDTTNKPQVVRPKPGNNTTPSPSPSPSPSNNNTNKNNTTNNNKTTTLTDAKSTVKAAKITVKKGKKAVSKVTVKKGKKVTLKVSVNSKGKLSVAKLSKKAKKIATVTLKKGKLTIKGKKKGKVTLKIKAAKTSKYKKATKSIKVTVK